MLRSIILSVFILMNSYLYANKIYVNQKNTGTTTGSFENPYTTIGQATNNAQLNDTIYIFSGVYREKITPKNDKITFIAWDDDVYVTGTDLMTNWIDVGNGVYKMFIPHRCTQVFVNKIPQLKARYPNSQVEGNLFDFSTINISLKDTIATINEVNQMNSSWNDGTIWMMVGHRWISQTARIGAYEDNKLHLNHLSNTAEGEGVAYITNTLQALDTIGEWHWQNDSLYYFFGTKGNINTTVIEAQTRTTVIDISNRKNINIIGLKMYSGNVNMNGTDNSIIKECEIKYLNNYHYINKEDVSWYSSWGRQKWTNINSLGIGIGVFGNNNLIDHCEISWSSGDCMTLYGSQNTVSNCIIHDANYLGGDMAPIALGGIGNTITHNEIYNGGRAIITFLSAKKFKITHNKIYSAGQLNWDIGCLYTYNTDGEEGEIAYNWIHDANPTNPQTKWGGHGIYFDNNSKNYIAHHNVIWNCKGDGIRLNKPANNLTVFNNTIFDCQDMITYLSPQFTGQSSANCSFQNNYLDGSILSEPWLQTSHNISSKTDYLIDKLNNDYRPVSFSPLIDSGLVISSEFEYIGIRPDIGAYENDGINWKVGPNSNEDIILDKVYKNEKESSMFYFPNPTTSNLYVLTNEFKRYTIYSNKGIKIEHGFIKDGKISMNNLTNGLYIINIYSQTLSENIKVIKE